MQALYSERNRENKITPCCHREAEGTEEGSHKHGEVRRDKDGRVPEDSETQLQHDHLTWASSRWHDSTQPTALLSRTGAQASRKKWGEEALGPPPGFPKLGPEVVFPPRSMGWEGCIISSLSQEAQPQQFPGHLPSAN